MGGGCCRLSRRILLGRATTAWGAEKAGTTGGIIWADARAARSGDIGAVGADAVAAVAAVAAAVTAAANAAAVMGAAGVES